MNVGYIIDNGFVLPAAVSICSLLKNNQHIDELNLYILDDGISEENKSMLMKMINGFFREAVFVPVKEVKDKLSIITKYNWNGSYSTYIRLMLNSIFPELNDRMLMIDADTIVVGRIDELADYDLKSYSCAMALEAMPISYYKYSGLGLNKLINGGLLLIDLKRWREEEMEKKIIEFLTIVRDKNMLTDEDVLSKIFNNKFSVISPRFNYLTQYHIFTTKFYYHFFGWNKLYKMGAFYSYEELAEAGSDPVILHCIDSQTNRPWHKNNHHPYSKIFDEYLSMTPWKEADKTIKSMSFIGKIEYFLRNFLPDSISRIYYGVVLKIYYGVGAKRYYSECRKDF